MLKASNGIRLLTASITVVLLVYRVLRIMTNRVTKTLKLMLAMTTTMTEPCYLWMASAKFIANTNTA